MRNEELQNNDEREPVRELLGSLKRVEAPANFDFGVKARIAAGKPAEKRGFHIPVLVGYAMPLVLLLLVGAYFGFNAFYSTKDANVPVVAVAPTTAAPQLPPPSIEVVPVPAPEQIAAVKKPEAITAPGVLSVKKPVVVPVTRPDGGSFDEGSSVPRKIYRNTLIPAKDVLTLLGAKGAFGENGWKVDAATTNSLAERSGVKAGDVIEAINDQTVTEKTTLKSRSGIKSVRVRRDGKSLEIVLKN